MSGILRILCLPTFFCNAPVFLHTSNGGTHDSVRHDGLRRRKILCFRRKILCFRRKIPGFLRSFRLRRNGLRRNVLLSGLRRLRLLPYEYLLSDHILILKHCAGKRPVIQKSLHTVATALAHNPFFLLALNTLADYLKFHILKGIHKTL